MGKIALFLFVIGFVIVFPFFIKSSNFKGYEKRVTPLQIEKGVIYEYNGSLKEEIKFETLLKEDNLIKFFNISYVNRENNYTLSAEEAFYNPKTKILKGKNYNFSASNISGSGKEFKKVGHIIYATDSKFRIKD